MAGEAKAKSRRKGKSLEDYVKEITDLGRPELATLAMAMSKGRRGVLSDMFTSVQRPRIMCADGLSLSVQANAYTYCEPRGNDGPYESVEAGMPSQPVEAMLPWAESPSNPTGSIYSRIPVSVVAWEVASRGGRADLDADWKSRSMLGDGPELAGAPAATGGPARLGTAVGAPRLAKAWERWAQEAALGSPAAERAARFEIWTPKGAAPVLDWAGMLVCAKALPPSEGEAPWERWALRAKEVASIHLAAGPGKARKPGAGRI